MSEHELGPLPSGRSDDDTTLLDGGAGAALRHSIAPDMAADPRSPSQTGRDQLARDIADIERAAAALQKAEPALQSWVKPPPPIASRPRPLWLLIGVLWLSTALLTVGAVVAIVTFAG